MFTRAQQLEAEQEFFSKQDDIRERYFAELRDIRAETLIEQQHHEYMNKVWAAGYGDDADAYESYWTRTLKYYEQQH